MGPHLLWRLAGFLGGLPDGHRLLGGYEWWVIPHINPDGAARNGSWQAAGAEAYEIADYLARVVRELPGDDIEFGFPRGSADREARPENRAAYSWWQGAAGPFHLHASLHGMAFGAGPWFLIEPAWRDRCDELMKRCEAATRGLGYTLHDVERGGEKGFFRIARGFCTRPDSRFMREHFMAMDDEATADRFRPSSMEAVRSLGGDPLTLVSEMPLFLTPGVGEDLGPPDPAAVLWRERLEGWRVRLRGTAAVDDAGADTAVWGAVAAEAAAAGLRPMPVAHQMRLQLAFITAGLDQVESEARA